jgi:hypothetical protein
MRVPSVPGTSEGKVGERAYRQQVERVVSGVVVGDDRPSTQSNARALTKASGLAGEGDFLGAIRVLGDVRVEVHEPEDQAVGPSDVEQALGDLRRAIVKAPAGDERDASARLLEAARAEASSGRWAAAWELVDEADERLAAAYFG